MTLLERRRQMMSRKIKPEIIPIYSVHNIAFPTGDTSGYAIDTGLMIFQENKSYTILTEFYYEEAGVSTFPWSCDSNWNFWNYQGHSWDSYISGGNPWQYYGSPSGFPDNKQTGRVRRIYQTYDSVNMRTRAQIDGMDIRQKEVSAFVPATGTLKIAVKGTWHPVAGEVRSVAIYDTLLKDAYLAQWLADTPTE